MAVDFMLFTYDLKMIALSPAIASRQEEPQTGFSCVYPLVKNLLNDRTWAVSKS